MVKEEPPPPTGFSITLAGTSLQAKRSTSGVQVTPSSQAKPRIRPLDDTVPANMAIKAHGRVLPAGEQGAQSSSSDDDTLTSSSTEQQHKQPRQNPPTSQPRLSQPLGGAALYPKPSDAPVNEWTAQIEEIKRFMKTIHNDIEEIQKEKAVAVASFDASIKEKLYQLHQAKLELKGFEEKIRLHENYVEGKHFHLDSPQRSNKRKLSLSFTEDDQSSLSRVITPTKSRVASSSSRSYNQRRGNIDALQDINSVRSLREDTISKESPYRGKRATDRPASASSSKKKTQEMLVSWRHRHVPDGTSRKLRAMCFDASNSDHFATSADDGSLQFWTLSKSRECSISKAGSLDSKHLKVIKPVAEALRFSPDGSHLAVALKNGMTVSDPKIAIVDCAKLGIYSHPGNRLNVTGKVLWTLGSKHANRGVTSIDWSLHPSRVLGGTVDHQVVLWENVFSSSSPPSRVVHSLHRAEIRSILLHSSKDKVFSCGLDGNLICYSLARDKEEWCVSRRKPVIEKLVEVLEHPFNSNLILFSGLTAEQSIYLYDIRSGSIVATAAWNRQDDRSVSQYIVPRWSPSGVHWSCGSTNGLLHLWDVRYISSGKSKGVHSPMQSVATGHSKMVLQGCWVPSLSSKLMITLSTDRTIGVHTYEYGAS